MLVKGTIHDWRLSRKLQIEVNAYWISIRDANTNKELWSRQPDQDNWSDESHLRITRALDELESALSAAANKDRKPNGSLK